MAKEELGIRSKSISDLANKLEKNNKLLKDEMLKTGTLMKKLGKDWQGDAYKECNAMYQKFVAKYSTEYDELLKTYIKFLREDISEGYKKTESKSASFKDSYK